jgi:putative acetyltransferase
MSNTDVVIRPVCVADWEAVGEIRRQPRVMEFTTAIPSERPGPAFIEALTPNDHVMVAQLDGRVVGVAGLHLAKGKRRHVAGLGIAVHDAFAGRGVGRALMQALIELADHWLGLVRVELDVDSTNERAQKLYESFGFVVEGRQAKSYFSAGRYTDAILMARLR